MKGLIRPKAKRAWKKPLQMLRLKDYLSYPPMQSDVGIFYRKGRYYDRYDRLEGTK